MITSGQLKQGDAVPSSNRLAQEHDISRNTITRAFGLLAEAGLIKWTPESVRYVVIWPDADVWAGSDPWMSGAESKHVHVANWIRTKIVRDELEWRMVVPGVTELCKRFGVSRPVVTRAMHLLTDEGLIEFLPRHRYYVVAGAQHPERCHEGTDSNNGKPVLQEERGINSAAGREDKPELILCPCCCRIDDVLSHQGDPEALAPLAGCARCSFRFPILPGEYAELTLEAMHRHHCRVSPEADNYEGVARAIIEHVHELGLNQSLLLERARFWTYAVRASEHLAESDPESPGTAG
jgi:DNA-binding transcriptional regulator YhcF (GntR family)